MEINQIYEFFEKKLEKTGKFLDEEEQKVNKLVQMYEECKLLKIQIQKKKEITSNISRLKETKQDSKVSQIRLQQTIKKEKQINNRLEKTVDVLGKSFKNDLTKKDENTDYKNRLKNYLHRRMFGVHIDMDSPKDIVQGAVINAQNLSINTFEFKTTDTDQEDITRQIYSLIQSNQSNSEFWNSPELFGSE